MKGFILYIISVFLIIIVRPFSFFVKLFAAIKQGLRPMNFKKLDNDFFLQAIKNDKIGNAEDSQLLAALFLTKESVHAFGNPKETISSVLGKNFLARTLTPRGYEICELLNAIQTNHVVLSIDNSL